MVRGGFTISTSELGTSYCTFLINSNFGILAPLEEEATTLFPHLGLSTVKNQESAIGNC
jgi:hypothetical protein